MIWIGAGLCLIGFVCFGLTFFVVSQIESDGPALSIAACMSVLTATLIMGGGITMDASLAQKCINSGGNYVSANCIKGDYEVIEP